MHVSMFLLVLALICCSVHSKSCVKDSDCYERDYNGNILSVGWQCCNQRCYSLNRGGCPCGFSEDQCPSGETCNYRKYRCEPYIPTKGTTTRRYTTQTSPRPTIISDHKSCMSDSDCGENEKCYGSRHASCISVDKNEDLKYNVLNIGLPVGLSLLLLPFFGYYGYKLKTLEERRRLRSYGMPYRLPVRRPQNSCTGTTEQPTSQATELQSVNSASSHNDRTVIEVECSSPSAPQLPSPQNVPIGEAVEPRGTDEQAGIAVSSAAVIGNSSGSLPGAPPPYNEIRRLQNGDVEEQPPPSYEEAIENYNVVRQ